METAAAPATAARSTSPATATAAPPAATTAAATAASTAAAQERSRLVTDSPQGKSDVVQSRQDGGFYPTRGRVAQNERDRERDEETERGV